MKTNIEIHNEPVRHIIIDNSFSEEMLCAVRKEWPDKSWPGWVNYDGVEEHKRASNLSHQIPISCALLLAEMAQFPIKYWFDDTSLIPDLGLHGGGLHEMDSGSELGSHLDADTHARLGLARMLSAVVYVHEKWHCEWDGQLKLDSKIITPWPGRMVIFDCRNVLHSVTEIRCPDDVYRRSLALFWYAPIVGSGDRKRALFSSNPSR